MIPALWRLLDKVLAPPPRQVEDQYIEDAAERVEALEQRVEALTVRAEQLHQQAHTDVRH